MKNRFVLIAGLVLSISTGPAFAFTNIEGCDIAAFAAKDAPVAIPLERWQAYRDATLAALTPERNEEPRDADLRALAAELIAAQQALIAPVRTSQAYRDYLAGESCRVLAELDSGSIENLLGEVAQTNPEPVATALTRVTQAARDQIETIERAARFRSLRDADIMAAGHYCFVAGAIMSLLPVEREQSLGLDSFGTTIPCREIGRTG